MPKCAPVKILTCFPTWANNRNLIFQAKLQNSLCSCTSWGYMCNTNEICDTYPESSWYKLLKNARKSWNNHKSYCTLLDNFGQKYPKTDTVLLGQIYHQCTNALLASTKMIPSCCPALVKRASHSRQTDLRLCFASRACSFHRYQIWQFC